VSTNGAADRSIGGRVHGRIGDDDDRSAAPEAGSARRPDRVTLHFGGHVGESEPVYPLKVTLGPHPQFAVPARMRAELASLPPADRAEAALRWHSDNAMYDPILAYANVAKTGREIGIVVIAGGNYWYEAGGVARMPTDAFVAKITARASPPPPRAPQ
jgi:hypothetical protein